LTRSASVAIPVVALIAYLFIALVAVRTVDRPPAVSPGPTRVQTVAIHADLATPGATNQRMYGFASSAEIGASFTIGAFEPKRVQTVAVPAGRSAAGRSAPDYRRDFVECTVACPK